ncbi:MAG TPA: DUF2789 family protein [Rhodocyclaceae bacterium]|nr:DUF2789 family protein [Rhodocyclaceae bacterium]
MGRATIDMSSLFSQLGYANDVASIHAFIEAKTPLASAVKLHEAAFWSASQSAFLREALLEDADWAIVVDALNAALR